MTDQQPPDGIDGIEGMPAEPAPPGRSLHGAAQDLSSLFGEETGERDPGATALGPQRRPHVASGGAGLDRVLDAIAQKIAFLETELAEAVSKIQSVDRHLATTYQALQGMVQRLPDPGDAATGTASLDTVTAGVRQLGERLEAVGHEVSRSNDLLGGRLERLGERLAAVEAELRNPGAPSAGAAEAGTRLAAVEVALTGTVDRLSGLEDRVASTLSHAEAGREATVELEKAVGELLGEFRAGRAASPAPIPSEPEPEVPAGQTLPSLSISSQPEPEPEPHVSIGPAVEPEAAPLPEPEGASTWSEPGPEADIDALLSAATPEPLSFLGRRAAAVARAAPEPEPQADASQEALYWSTPAREPEPEDGAPTASDDTERASEPEPLSEPLSEDAADPVVDLEVVPEPGRADEPPADESGEPTDSIHRFVDDDETGDPIAPAPFWRGGSSSS